jgi:hypothetical protein
MLAADKISDFSYGDGRHTLKIGVRRGERIPKKTGARRGEELYIIPRLQVQ